LAPVDVRLASIGLLASALWSESLTIRSFHAIRDFGQTTINKINKDACNVHFDDTSSGDHLLRQPGKPPAVVANVPERQA